MDFSRFVTVFTLCTFCSQVRSQGGDTSIGLTPSEGDIFTLTCNQSLLSGLRLTLNGESDLRGFSIGGFGDTFTSYGKTTLDPQDNWRLARCCTDNQKSNPFRITVPNGIDLPINATASPENAIVVRGGNLSITCTPTSVCTTGVVLRQDGDPTSYTTFTNSTDPGTGATTFDFMGQVMDDMNGVVLQCTCNTGEFGSNHFIIDVLDQTVQFESPSYSVIEGGTVEIRIVLDVASSRELTVDLAITPNSAEAGSDYPDLARTVTFAPGVGEQSISITPENDPVNERMEDFSVGLRNPSDGLVIGQNSASTIFIMNDDELEVGFDPAISQYIVFEGRSVSLMARLNGTADRDLTVMVGTTDVTTSDDDYTIPETITFPAGMTAFSIDLRALIDDDRVINESLIVSLLPNPTENDLTVSEETVTVFIIGNCSVLNGGCQQECTDTGNSITCSCRERFVLQSDGTSCRPTCGTDNGGCQQECDASGDSIVCRCSIVYTLQEDGESCAVSGGAVGGFAAAGVVVLLVAVGGGGAVVVVAPKLIKRKRKGRVEEEPKPEQTAVSFNPTEEKVDL